VCVDVSQDRRVSGCVTGHVSRKCRVSRQLSRGVSRCVTSQDHSCFSPDTTRAGALPSAPATLVFPITAGLDLLFAVCSTTRVVCAVVGEWDASTHCMPRHIGCLDTLYASTHCDARHLACQLATRLRARMRLRPNTHTRKNSEQEEETAG